MIQDIWIFFVKYTKKMKVLLKYEKNDENFTRRPLYIYHNTSLNSSRWSRDFSHPSRPAHLASCIMGTGSFLGVKRPGHGADHKSPFSDEVKQE
jgi:hypothetical protein